MRAFFASLLFVCVSATPGLAQNSLPYPRELQGVWRLDVESCSRAEARGAADAMVIEGAEMRGPEVDRKARSIRQVADHPKTWLASLSDNADGGTLATVLVLSRYDQREILTVIQGLPQVFTRCR